MVVFLNIYLKSDKSSTADYFWIPITSNKPGLQIFLKFKKWQSIKKLWSISKRRSCTVQLFCKITGPIHVKRIVNLLYGNEMFDPIHCTTMDIWLNKGVFYLIWLQNDSRCMKSVKDHNKWIFISPDP